MRYLAVCASLVLSAAAAYADPLAGVTLPQDTRWVIHVDVDGARQAAPLWELARVKLIAPRRADILPKLAVVERITGMKLPQDLHDVTLYGTTFDEGSVCVRIHGPMDEANVAAFLRADPEFRQDTYGGHDVLRWRDKARDRLMYAGFAAKDMVVLSADAKAVEGALDALDGKSTLKADSPLSPQSVGGVGGAGQPLLWMAAENLAELPRTQKVESPVLAQIDAASLSLAWSNDRALAELRVAAKSDTSAQQLQAVAEGVKAFVALSAADDHAPPRLRLASGALQQLNVRAQGKMVKGEWSVELDKIELLVNLAAQEQAAGTMAAPAATDRKP